MVLLTQLLTQSSSSSPTQDHQYHPIHRYDVFLSFRGADTRNRFTDHLYNALLDAGITTFLDDEEIDTGEPLKPELEGAIKSSKASVIVLSKNYAFSTWCLDELVLILDRKSNFNQIVVPIFYHVEPTHVRKQQSSFGEAMAKHKQKMEAETNAEKRCELAHKMELWKRALTQVAALKGRDVKHKKETEFIKEVVTEIHQRLGVPSSNTLPRLIGMDDSIESISSWLTDGSCHSVDILTIVGMSGIGKTSLAKYVFQLHSSKFEKSSFIEGIGARCKQHFNGLLYLQKQLCGDILKNIPLHLHDESVYISKIENTLAQKKVLLVLDDVGSLDELDALLGNKAFHRGSKVIITTKDASLTERCALFNAQIQPKHNIVSLNGLCKFESLVLLCIHAFTSQETKEGYKEVSEKLVEYCEGHPLAIQVLGRSLQKRDVAYWEECIKVLKKEPHSQINRTLKMSFDALQTKNDKELFKHIACFFVGIDRDVTEIILNACGINTRYGITNLIDRCLLRIGRKNELLMHQLVQEMGRDLVRQESPEKPWERSRLWCHEESFNVLEQNKGTGNILGLALDMRMFEKDKLSGSLQLKTDALIKMNNLKLLQLNYAKINGSYENLPKQLRWLCMHGFHYKSIPSKLPLMEYLVALDLSHSSIETFDMSYSSSQRFMSRLKGLIGSSSKDKQFLGSLKILDLSFCEKLHSVGGFSELPALERLIVRECISLIEVCESVEQCVELVHIDMRYCQKLKKLPISLGKLKKVKTLLLDGCNSLETQIEAIPSDFKLIAFYLPTSLVKLSLRNNNLSNKSFPVDFSSLSMLEELCLDENPIVSMPDCVRTLPRLERLSMQYCKILLSIERPPCTLRVLSFYSTATKKIKLDPEMSPLKLEGAPINYTDSSFEIDGVVKIQPIVGVGEKVLHSLGWTNLDLNKDRCFGPGYHLVDKMFFYEFGIFSTFNEGKEMPDWISCRSKDPSISFTIPSSPSKLRGLNFCCTLDISPYHCFAVPMIEITNVTKNHTWIYLHYMSGLSFNGNYCLRWLSHWIFGPNEMEGGDQVTITVGQSYQSYYLYKEVRAMEWGIGIVYDGASMEEKEDVLGYYKSWNHIIGGDLSHFQLATGEYILDHTLFRRYSPEVNSYYSHFIDYEAKFKEEKVSFKAFSQKKCDQGHGMNPNSMFPMMLNPMAFGSHQLNYAAMSNLLAQQQLLSTVNNLQSQNHGPASSSSAFPDIFNPVIASQTPTSTMNSSKKDDTKAFDFISDHLAAARTRKG